MSVTFWAFLGSFLGSATGTVYSIRLATRYLLKLAHDDPELEKVDIHVTMVERDR